MIAIAIKPLGIDESEGLQKQLEVFGLNIDTDQERVVIKYRIVLLSPKGNTVKVLETKQYERFNSKIGDFSPESRLKIVTQNNLKFDELRNSALGQGIAGMITLDISKYDGTEESLKQFIYTDPQP